LLTQIREEYKKAFPCDVAFIEAGIDIVRVNWVNKRLEEMSENWRVELDRSEGGYKMPNLES
jgi:hypothetical protein